MCTVLDIDLDFFVSPIQHWKQSHDRVPDAEATPESVEEVLHYLNANCGLPTESKTPGAWFEHHDELFDFAVKHVAEPMHLVHLDAHADIGGGLTRCWEYVFTQYTHLSLPFRRHPKRGARHLNCGNFIVFLAACGLLERVTFVAHPAWQDDYNGLYMKDFDLGSEALQLKRFEKSVIDESKLLTPLYDLPHEVEAAVPFVRVNRDDYHAEHKPDLLFVTRSPGYTPASADPLFEALARRIELL